MSTTAASPESEPAIQTRVEENMPHVGLITRMISWIADLVIINLVAIITGLGAQLIVNMFPITKNLQPLFVAIAGAVYVLWNAGYFVVFWSTTGQTPGARLMQVRLVAASGDKVKPARALIRWIGMNLALVPLPWGFVPIPLRRRGFPDWVAHTRVIEVEQLSIANQRRQRSRNPRDTSQQPPSSVPSL